MQTGNTQLLTPAADLPMWHACHAVSTQPDVWQASVSNRLLCCVWQASATAHCYYPRMQLACTAHAVLCPCVIPALASECVRACGHSPYPAAHTYGGCRRLTLWGKATPYPSGLLHMAPQIPRTADAPHRTHQPPCKHTNKHRSLGGTGCCGSVPGMLTLQEESKVSWLGLGGGVGAAAAAAVTAASLSQPISLECAAVLQHFDCMLQQLLAANLLVLLPTAMLSLLHSIKKYSNHACHYGRL